MLHEPTPGDKLHALLPRLHEDGAVGVSAEYATLHGNEKATANASQKIGAHVLRLESLMGRSEAVEHRVWQSAVDELIIKESDVPESYWSQQKQLARDNGQGDINFTSDMKSGLTRQLQDAQRTGAESWATYLEHVGGQYPTWFKLYAWKGMSRLGVFDKTKGIYRTRSQGTVAPYPQLNPAALSKVYETVEKRFEGKEASDEQVAKLARSGNFNKLYSHFLLNQKSVIPTPEKPEDVHGVWQEYTGDDIEALTHAAESTPWCIAGEGTARHYTKNGGKFLLFHLSDPETGATSPTAAASIRLNAEGYVAEISGLKDGSNQYLEDALVPEVQAKVATLPGGGRYLRAFADKQQLIAMDKKFQAHEPFTADELRFIYEVDRDIEYVDTYQHDPRPRQFTSERHKENYEILCAAYGDASAELMMLLDSQEVDERFDELLNKGADVNLLTRRLPQYRVYDEADTLLAMGVDLNTFVDRLSSGQVAGKINQLLAIGIDVNKIKSKMWSMDIIEHLDVLRKAGAVIDVSEELSQVPSHRRAFLVAENVGKLLEAGMELDINKVVKDVSLDDYYEQIPGLANIEQGRMDRICIGLINAGANPKMLVQNLSDDAKVQHVRELVAAGMDVLDLVKEVDDTDMLLAHLPEFRKVGLDDESEKDVLSHRLWTGSEVLKHLNTLKAVGISGEQIGRLVESLSPDKVIDHLDELLAAGVSEDKLDDIIGMRVNGWPVKRRLYSRKLP